MSGGVMAGRAPRTDAPGRPRSAGSPQALEHEPVELGVRLPGLAGDDTAIADRLIGGDVVAAGRLDLPAAVLVGGDAPALDQIRCGEDLDAVADREHPLLRRIEAA